MRLSRRYRIRAIFPWEALVWVAGLLILVFQDPGEATHFSICTFKWLGFSECPGCGLGRAVSLLARGDWIESLHMHPLAGPVVAILMFRIFQSLRESIVKIVT